MRTTILKTIALGFTLAASQALAGSDSPFGTLSQYNDAMGSGPAPAVVSFPAGASGAQSFDATPLSELSRYNDPIGSGAAPAAVAQADRSMAASETQRGTRFWRFLSRNQRIIN